MSGSTSWSIPKYFGGVRFQLQWQEENCRELPDDTLLATILGDTLLATPTAMARDKITRNQCIWTLLKYTSYFPTWQSTKLQKFESPKDLKFESSLKV